MKPHRYFTRFVALGAAALVTCLASTGCQKDYRTMAGDAANNCSSGKYGQAAKLSAEASSKLKQDDIDRVAYLMEAGRCAQLNGDLETSDKMLGDASDEVRPYLDSKAEAKVTEGVATTVLNQTVSIYRGTNLERTMLATLLAMNAMVRGDAQEARRNLILASEWQQLAAELHTAGECDPDLLIRTSGEMRLSNFLLWQLSYTEFYITEKLWPDFGKDELNDAVRDYGERHRRFGAV